MRNAYKILVRKPEGKRLLGKPWHRWEDNIKEELQDIIYADVDWIHLKQDRSSRGSSEIIIINVQVLKFREILDYLSEYWLFKKDAVP
jgi:predicted phosphatase